VFLCLALALVIYNSDDVIRLDTVTRLCFDYFGASLFVSAVVPILVGLSLASSVYYRTSWQSLVCEHALGRHHDLLDNQQRTRD
jgi:hypothetical protein